MCDDIKAPESEVKNTEVPTKAEATPEVVDPWSPEQRSLVDELTKTNSATLCDKISTFPTIIIPADSLSEYMTNLFETHKFDMLKSHTCVDWPEEEEFELITLLFSTTSLQHIWVSARVPRTNPVISTISHIWPIAEFQEREVYDLFGILYENHKDLRRLFLDDDWEGFPLRKDFKDDFMLERPL